MKINNPKNSKEIAMAKTMLILIIAIGTTVALTSDDINGLFGVGILLVGLYGYYNFEKCTIEVKDGRN